MWMTYHRETGRLMASRIESGWQLDTARSALASSDVTAVERLSWRPSAKLVGRRGYDRQSATLPQQAPVVLLHHRYNYSLCVIGFRRLGSSQGMVNPNFVTSTHMTTQNSTWKSPLVWPSDLVATLTFDFLTSFCSKLQNQHVKVYSKIRFWQCLLWPSPLSHDFKTWSVCVNLLVQHTPTATAFKNRRSSLANVAL